MSESMQSYKQFRNSVFQEPEPDSIPESQQTELTLESHQSPTMTVRVLCWGNCFFHVSPKDSCGDPQHSNGSKHKRSMRTPRTSTVLLAHKTGTKMLRAVQPRTKNSMRRPAQRTYQCGGSHKKHAETRTKSICGGPHKEHAETRTKHDMARSKCARAFFSRLNHVSSDVHAHT